jgi:hypothetical protein
MTARTEALIVAAALLVALGGCGGSDDKASLTIANDQGDGANLEITNVLIQECFTRYWTPEAVQFNDMRPMSEQSPMTIAPGDSHDFDLAPGCHDVLVARANASGDDNARFASARVILEAGQSAKWIPFQVNDNDSWWCFEDDCK